MGHLPNYHFCHKNLVQSIDFLPSSGIHRHCHREICLYLLATKKKLTFDKGHNAPVLLRLTETRIMLHFSMGHGGKVFPIHTFLKYKHVHDLTLLDTLAKCFWSHPKQVDQ